MKTCNKCKQLKSLEEFNQHKRNKDGYRYTCRQCELEERRAYYSTPRGKWNSYRSSARQRKLKFALTYEEFMSFWQKPCSYCGAQINTIGIDRIDNTVGYILENVTSCCTECNFFKKDMHRDELFSHVRRISSFLLTILDECY